MFQDILLEEYHGTFHDIQDASSWCLIFKTSLDVVIDLCLHINQCRIFQALARMAKPLSFHISKNTQSWPLFRRYEERELAI